MSYDTDRRGAPPPAPAVSEKRALLSYVRHQLRNPVSVILGYAEMLIEDAPELGRHDLIPDLRKFLDCGRTLLALIDETMAAESRAAERPTDLAAFAADVQYRLRVPLNTIIGYSDLLAEESCGLGAEFVSVIRNIGQAGRRLLSLADEIANFRLQDFGASPDPSLEQRLELDKVRQTVESLRAPGAAACASEREWGRLLVADDGELSRDLLSRYLGREGHVVAVARDGAEALRMLRAGEQQFDLLLLDIMMPEMNGFQLLECIKADAELRSLPIIIVSALAEKGSVIRCMQMGADDYLEKPCNQMELRARVGACLDRKRLREAEFKREKADQLLRNILPPAIADRLRDGPCLIAERFKEVSVIFADIVGFTSWSAGVRADEVVHVLDDIFSRFDALAERHGLEKIKTIGDCYMAAAGLPTPRPDHAEAVAEMALDMQAEVEAFNRARGSPLTIRTGIHTGPVVAGVVGKRKFIYDLWGDTVNTASRMESHGLPGRIQVTGETWARLKAGYLFERRGEIEVSGKGAMITYFLTGRKRNGPARAV